jgi:hypothetical protein
MNIIGPDELLFGVDDVAACTQYLSDYGLTPVDVGPAGGRFDEQLSSVSASRGVGAPRLAACSPATAGWCAAASAAVSRTSAAPCWVWGMR